MDALNRIVAIPAWAYDFCWVYFVMAALIFVNGIWALWKLVSLPAIVRKVLPLPSIFIAILLSGAFSIALAMMQFWICRSSLKPGKEHFAVTCKGDADCTAVMGTQSAGSACTCGGRGFCGGCVMNNNMEPQSSFASEFAPIEGFAAMTPQQKQLRKVALPKPSKMPMRRA